ncbi:hypothetical protein PF010_g15559 [Phytophthora fragariae]|uniref:Uncharacterized protein n=1 Tax=Phytophthora fragariae TaxID=53985 RepID=A0A6G0KTM2_9STRA|nr:hypothetical protein PF010_g15559 [Phytophthora fragariae]
MRTWTRSTQAGMALFPDDDQTLEPALSFIDEFPFESLSGAQVAVVKTADLHTNEVAIYEKAAKNLDDPYTIVEDFTKELNLAQAYYKSEQANWRAIVRASRV